MKVTVCIIARMASSRLPSKVISEIDGRPLVENILHNLFRSRATNIEFVLCTTELPEEKPLEEIAISNNVKIIKGSVLSVSDRMLEAAKLTKADIVVRVTGDNIFTDVILMDELIKNHIEYDVEYSRFGNLPNGVSAEVMNVSALEACYKLNDKNTSEYMTLHMFNPQAYRALVMHAEEKLARPVINLSIDTPVDLQRTLSIFKCAKDPFNLLEVIECIESNKYEGSFINETGMVKLIDREIPYFEFKKYLQELELKSERVILNNGWYEQKVIEYRN